MRLTIGVHSFEAIPLEGALAICKSMGFKGVDVAGFHNRGRLSYEPDEVGATPERCADHLNAMLDKFGLDSVDFFPQFANDFTERSMNDPNPAVVQKNVEMFKGIAKFCKLTKTPGITVLPGVDFPQFSREQNLDRAAQTFRTLVQIAGESGVETRFEAHMGSLTSTPELAAALIERAPGLKLTLDYSHFLLQYIPIERIHALIPLTGHFHVRQARPGKLQVRHAEGTLDFVDIARRLKAAGYQGCMSLEYVCQDWYDGNQLDTLNETMLTKAQLEPHVSAT